MLGWKQLLRFIMIDRCEITIQDTIFTSKTITHGKVYSQSAYNKMVQMKRKHKQHML